MLEGLERIDWERLTHAYGPAGEVPGWIRELTSDDAAVRKRAFDVLEGSICHQGSRYRASAPAVPFLFELLTHPGVTEAFVPALDAELETFESVIVQRLAPEALVQGLATRSYVATMTEQRRADFLGAVRELLAAHPDTRGLDVVDVRLVTSVWRLLPRSLHR